MRPNKSKIAASISPDFLHFFKIKIMRRFPFFLAPLVGMVALFFLFKLLLTAVLGLVIFGGAFMAIRRMTGSGYHRGMHLASIKQRRPVPIDARHSEQAFDWMHQNRIIEVI